MKTISEILEMHFKKVNLKWFTKKRFEFTSSHAFNTATDLLEFRDLEILQNFNEEFDDEGKLISREIIDEIENKINIDISFMEYCKLPISDKSKFTEETEIVFKCKDLELKLIDGLSDFISSLVKDLEPFFTELDAKEVPDFINNIYDELMEMHISSDNNENVTFLKIRRDFVEIFKLELQLINITKLESAKYLFANISKLKFNLSMEDYSALMRIIFEANLLDEPINNFLDFAEKHFLYIPQGKQTFANTNSAQLKKNMGKHGTDSHLGKGITNIDVKLNDAIAEI